MQLGIPVIPKDPPKGLPGYMRENVASFRLGAVAEMATLSTATSPRTGSTSGDWPIQAPGCLNAIPISDV